MTGPHIPEEAGPRVNREEGRTEEWTLFVGRGCGRATVAPHVRTWKDCDCDGPPTPGHEGKTEACPDDAIRVVPASLLAQEREERQETTRLAREAWKAKQAAEKQRDEAEARVEETRKLNDEIRKKLIEVRAVRDEALARAQRRGELLKIAHAEAVKQERRATQAEAALEEVRKWADGAPRGMLDNSGGGWTNRILSLADAALQSERNTDGRA